MKIQLNEEMVSIEQSVSLKELLSMFGYGQAKIAVALNKEFVPKAMHEKIVIQENDVISIIIPVQGG